MAAAAAGAAAADCALHMCVCVSDLEAPSTHLLFLSLHFDGGPASFLLVDIYCAASSCCVNDVSLLLLQWLLQTRQETLPDNDNTNLRALRPFLPLGRILAKVSSSPSAPNSSALVCSQHGWIACVRSIIVKTNGELSLLQRLQIATRKILFFCLGLLPGEEELIAIATARLIYIGFIHENFDRAILIA